MKLRQDAWTEEDDLLLAETVLRHVREGSTQLNAFEEVGDSLERTSAACGFRWNSVVRQRYEQALSLARKQRKHRQRMLGIDQGGKKKILYQPRVMDELSDVRNEDVFYINDNVVVNDNENLESAQVNQNLVDQKKVNLNSVLSKRHDTNIDDVIIFLQSLRKNISIMSGLKAENERLVLEINELKRKNEELENIVGSMQVDSSTLQEDYAALISIMNKARKMVMEEDEEERPKTKFKMDKNGNLEKIAE